MFYYATRLSNIEVRIYIYIYDNRCTQVANCLCDLRNSGNKHQITNVALEWVHKQFVTRVHTIILFFIRHNDSINGDKTTIFLYRPRVSLARFTFCWWRHNRLLMMSQWPDNSNYDAITWMVISNSLDIDFIHDDIHDRSCKKPQIAKFMQPTWGPPGACRPQMGLMGAP